jgi:hypothetical protein
LKEENVNVVAKKSLSQLKEKHFKELVIIQAVLGHIKESIENTKKIDTDKIKAEVKKKLKKYKGR